MYTLPVSLAFFLKKKTFPNVLSNPLTHSRTFEGEYDLIAKQWLKQPPAIRDSHFFAMLDFKEGKGTFQKVEFEPALLFPSLH